jgi:iron complex outermembrane receptor protein
VYNLPTDGYALFSAELGFREATLLGQRIQASLTARNLFNATYRDYLSRYRLYVDDPGRDIVLRLRVLFGASNP